MQSDIKTTGSPVFEALGKLTFASFVAGAVFALTVAFASKKDSPKKYEDRLRSAYDGLSEEEY